MSKSLNSLTKPQLVALLVAERADLLVAVNEVARQRSLISALEASLPAVKPVRPAYVAPAPSAAQLAFRAACAMAKANAIGGKASVLVRVSA